MKSLLFLSACVNFALLFSLPAEAQYADKSVNTGTEAVYRPLLIVESCSSTAPTGYLLSYRRDVTFCNGQKSYVYESYYDKPVGAYMDVCQQTLPTGWVFVAVHTGYTVCAPRQYWNIQRTY